MSEDEKRFGDRLRAEIRAVLGRDAQGSLARLADAIDADAALLREEIDELKKHLDEACRP